MIRILLLLASTGAVADSSSECDAGTDEVCLVQTVARSASIDVEGEDVQLPADVDPEQKLDMENLPEWAPIVEDGEDDEVLISSALLKNLDLVDVAHVTETEAFDQLVADASRKQRLANKVIDPKMHPTAAQRADAKKPRGERQPAEDLIGCIAEYGELFTMDAFAACIGRTYETVSFQLKYPYLYKLCAEAGSPTIFTEFLAALNDRAPQWVSRVVGHPITFLEQVENLCEEATGRPVAMKQVFEHPRAFFDFLFQFELGKIDHVAARQWSDSNHDVEAVPAILEESVKLDPAAMRAFADYIAEETAKVIAPDGEDGGAYQNFVQMLQQRLVQKGHATDANVVQMVQQKLSQLNVSTADDVHELLVQHTMNHFKIPRNVQGLVAGADRTNLAPWREIDSKKQRRPIHDFSDF